MAALDLIAAPPVPITGPFADIAGPVPAEQRFAPLFTADTEPYALASLDELGRSLAGVYVPDSLLL